MTDGMTAEERFLTDLKARRTKGTVKSYRRGLDLFLEYYRKNSDMVLAERKADIQSEDFEKTKRFDREIEKFYKWQLEKKYSLASARTNTIGICQFFKFFGLAVDPDIPMPKGTTRTYIPTMENLRAMFQCADIRGKVLLSLGLDTASRVSDIMSIRVKELPNLDQPSPIPFQRITQKEKTMQATFISRETVELLKAYLPTLNPLNEFLFQTNGHNYLDEERINGTLRQLVERAKIPIPNGQKLTYHSLRKRFLSTCYDLDIDSDIARLMCGKSIGASMEVYLGSANLKNSFTKVREENLSLSNGKIKPMIESKDKKIAELEAKIQKLETFIEIMTALNNKQIVEKAVEQLKQQGFKETFVFGDKENAYYTCTEDKSKNFKVKKDSAIELLNKIAELKKQKQDAEYKKLLENGNGEVT